MSKLKRILLWSLVNDALIGLILFLIWNKTGQTEYPEITSPFNKDEIIQLPFMLTRWWDLIMGPIFALIGVLAWSKCHDDSTGQFGVAGYLVVGMLTTCIGGVWFLLFFIAFGVLCSIGFVLLVAVITLLVWVFKGLKRLFNFQKPGE